MKVLSRQTLRSLYWKKLSWYSRSGPKLPPIRAAQSTAWHLSSSYPATSDPIPANLVNGASHRIDTTAGHAVTQPATSNGQCSWIRSDHTNVFPSIRCGSKLPLCAHTFLQCRLHHCAGWTEPHRPQAAAKSSAGTRHHLLRGQFHVLSDHLGLPRLQRHS